MKITKVFWKAIVSSRLQQININISQVYRFVQHNNQFCTTRMKNTHTPHNSMSEIHSVWSNEINNNKNCTINSSISGPFSWVTIAGLFSFCENENLIFIKKDEEMPYTRGRLVNGNWAHFVHYSVVFGHFQKQKNKFHCHGRFNVHTMCFENLII